MNSILLTVSADADFYEKFSDIFINKGFVKDFWRILGWGIVKMLAWLCNACEDLLIVANKTIGFIYSDSVVDFVSKWRFIIIGVLIIAILLFGITMIVNKKQDRSKLLQNFAISICVLTGLATFIPTLGSNTSTWSQALLEANSFTSADTVIKDAVIDLYFLDSNDFSDESVIDKNNIASSRIINIDPTETISGSDDVYNSDIFSYKITTDKNGIPELKEIDDSGFSWNNDPYYRYNIDYTTIYITLFATAIVMIFTAFKVIKIVFDIIVHQILATIMAASDWVSGQKLKEVLKSLFALFFSVFMCSVMIKLYFLFSAWISGNVTNSGARLLLLVFAAFAVIDGPNIVEKVFGVDAGLASTFRSVSTLFFASRGFADLTRGIGHSINTTLRGAAHGAGALGGIFGGFKNARSNAETATKGKEKISDASSKKGDSTNLTVENSKKGNNTSADNQNLKDTLKSENTPDPKRTTDNDNLKLNGEGNNPSDNSKPNANTADSDKKSVANAVVTQSAKKKNNNSDYFDRKAHNQRSVIGAGTRGYQTGEYIGEKIGNAATKVSEKRQQRNNLKGDK